MENSADKGKEKHREDLLMDGAFHLPLAHTDFLHNLEALVIIISLCNLFIINNQNRSDEEQQAEKNSYKKEASIKNIPFLLNCVIVLG